MTAQVILPIAEHDWLK